jgi:hypothetical protein
VGGAKTAEAPALHAAREALALRNAGDIDQLAGNEMLRANGRADIEERILGDAEFDDLGFRLAPGHAERGALRLGDVLRLRLSGAQLDGRVTVPILLAAADDLKLVQLQDGYRHVPTVRLEQAGHSDLLCDHASAHDQFAPLRGTWKSMCVKPIQNFCMPRPG